MPRPSPRLTPTLCAPSFHAPSQATVSNNIVCSFLPRHHAPSSPHVLFPASIARRRAQPRPYVADAPSILVILGFQPPSMPQVLNVGRSTTNGNLRTGYSDKTKEVRSGGRGSRGQGQLTAMLNSDERRSHDSSRDQPRVGYAVTA